jgi:glycosyltransferase involved in cell wall biosynthesis
MRILFVHNFYQHSGGEDTVVAAEAALLEKRGHELVRYVRHNDELGQSGGLSAGINTVWGVRAFSDLGKLIATTRPHVAHFHNTFPLISPSGYHACAQSHVPVIQTVHNYRLICPAATLLRDGRVCEDCLGRSVAWPAVLHKCYRQDRMATIATAAMLATHRVLGTWRDKVDTYIALTEFSRQKLISGGLPSERVVVKPHFVDPDPGPVQEPGEHALFLGRLSEEKGLRILLDAWKRLKNAIPLSIAGEGPLREELEAKATTTNPGRVKFSGRIPPQDIFQEIRKARFVVFPSICLETFGLSIVEAFACGVPVIASRLGSLAEIVCDGITGLHFSAGDPDDLAAKVDWAWTHADEMKRMGANARTEFENKYTANRNYDQFVALWHRLGLNEHSN